MVLIVWLLVKKTGIPKSQSDSWASCQIRKIASLRMRRKCRERFTRQRGLEIPTCITVKVVAGKRSRRMRNPLFCVSGKRLMAWQVVSWTWTSTVRLIVRRAGLLWSQQDFEWRWSVPLFKCLTVLEFSFILFDLCLLITFFNFIMNYVPIVTFWIFTYHKIWILSIMFCFIWSYWIIYFLACLEVSWRVVS